MSAAASIGGGANEEPYATGYCAISTKLSTELSTASQTVDKMTQFYATFLSIAEGYIHIGIYLSYIMGFWSIAYNIFKALSVSK